MCFLSNAIFISIFVISEIQQKTKCETNCPPVVEKVCGTDDKPYQNVCFLQKTACELKKDIRLQYAGSCGKCWESYCKAFFYREGKVGAP